MEKEVTVSFAKFFENEFWPYHERLIGIFFFFNFLREKKQ